MKAQLLKITSSALILSMSISQVSSACRPGEVTTPSSSSINQGLTSPSEEFMTTILGKPITPAPSSQPVDGCYPNKQVNAKIKNLLVTENVGPFRVTGLKPAVEVLKRIFAKVKKQEPGLHAQLATDGMMCARPKKANGKYRMGTWSNHSWGLAIDIKIKNHSDKQGDKCTVSQLQKLYPYFHDERFYWGAGYSTLEDSMHFETSTELLTRWQANGVFNRK